MDKIRTDFALLICCLASLVIYINVAKYKHQHNYVVKYCQKSLIL